MLCNHKNPIRFIHIKKNGGTSAYKFLRKNKINVLIGLEENFLATQHYTAEKFINENSFKICVIRNPYTRLVSFYNWIIRNKKYTFSFDEFVYTKYNKGRAQGAWNLQCDYILDDKDKVLVDKIFRFESMHIDIKKYFEIEARFPHLNKSTHSNHLDYYNQKTKQIVKEHFRTDFEILGY